MANFHYNSHWEDENKRKKRENIFSVEYYYMEDLSDDKLTEYWNNFEKQMNKYHGSDIVELTKIVKETLAGINEYNLIINIYNANMRQEVEYREGYLDSCSFHYKDNWNDYITVSETYKGISIDYHTDKYLTNNKDAQLIKCMLSICFNGILALKQMNKSYQEENSDKSLNLNISK